MGATIIGWTDRTPATIIQIALNNKKIVIQEDSAIRIDNNGMSEVQSYEYSRDPNGEIYTATLRKDNTYRITGSKIIVAIGSRRKYHDYSF